MLPIFCCWICHRPIHLPKNGLCSFCQQAIVHPPYCMGCGNKTPYYTNWCGKCSPEYNWECLIRAGELSSPLSDLIYQFKFHQAYYLDKTLARLLLLEIKNARRECYFAMPEVIIPVPLYHKRKWHRGYNQSELLANQLGKWLQIKVESEWIIRHKHTPTQRGLTSKGRKKNIDGAFSLKKKVARYKRIAIVDDVFTTGATIMEMCRLFKTVGVEEIMIWVLART
ncbi:ComF family protein [Actinobacillus delphinicola]|uniref:Competence protein F n=1 Tax=Actinobacillus delphinicola TaxID=51161 RepID=A0A448TU77_9PAST|nr:phosphoribosyltransferase family protein [Actinobacillus delphinicola]VEJ09552.1 competence protein F [Actinobacillus delphinicola]